MIRKIFIHGDDHFFINEDGHLILSDGRDNTGTIVNKRNLQAFTEFLLGELTEQKLEAEINGR